MLQAPSSKLNFGLLVALKRTVLYSGRCDACAWRVLSLRPARSALTGRPFLRRSALYNARLADGSRRSYGTAPSATARKLARAQIYGSRSRLDQLDLKRIRGCTLTGMQKVSSTRVRRSEKKRKKMRGRGKGAKVGSSSEKVGLVCFV